jgi:hypothetical protein
MQTWPLTSVAQIRDREWNTTFTLPIACKKSIGFQAFQFPLLWTFYQTTNQQPYCPIVASFAIAVIKCTLKQTPKPKPGHQIPSNLFCQIVYRLCCFQWFTWLEGRLKKKYYTGFKTWLKFEVGCSSIFRRVACWGFRSGATEVSVLWGCCAASRSDWCPTFRDSVVVPPPKIQCPVEVEPNFLDYWTLGSRFNRIRVLVSMKYCSEDELCPASQKLRAVIYVSK